jgi:hypothetical protein
VPADTPLTAAHVTDAGMAGLVAAGRVAVPLPRDVAPGIEAGAVVDVLSAGQQGAGRLASGARVLAVDEAHLWVEVARDEAPDVAAAAGWGAVSIALVGS